MENTKTIQSLERALDVLEAVAESREMGVSEIGRKLGLHVATTHNIVRTLTARGYLMNIDGRYQLGTATSVLSARSNTTASLGALIEPELEAIVKSTREAASATVLVGERAELIAFKMGTEEVTTQLPRWSWDIPLWLATGKLLVAFESKEMMARQIERYTDKRNDMTAEDFYKEFEEIREEEASYLLPEKKQIQYAVAGAVKMRGGRIMAAIGLSCPVFRASEEHRAEMKKAVLEACANVSEKLGFKK